MTSVLRRVDLMVCGWKETGVEDRSKEVQITDIDEL